MTSTKGNVIIVSSKNRRVVLTQQDATQCADAFEHLMSEMSVAPPKHFLTTVKPPFKCNECKRKIQLSTGYKLRKEKLCERCAQASLVKGYQLLKQSEALTGRQLISADARDVCEQLSPKTPPLN